MTTQVMPGTRPAQAAAAPEGDPRWARPAMWGVLVLAAVLYMWALGSNGYANNYYAAAIYSGTQSWKAFFFGALDSGSFITVDKPPFALWVMGLSARIFGFGAWSMLLPQAVAGVAAVWLVHSAVRRGVADRLSRKAAHAAALIAALVMTLTPITVAINRDNNPDTILVFLLVAAAWFCQEAIRTGRMRSLLVSALLIGLAFNTKMLQAYLVLPAFALVYLYAAPGRWLRRLGHLLAAGAALLVSSGWWMVVVDLWPASSRPYVGGSENNTVWDLVIGYNGLGRIFGRGGPGGGGFGGGGGASFGGASGADRLFNDIVAGQISWLLPFAAVALVAGLILTTRRMSGVAADGVRHAEPDGSQPGDAGFEDAREAGGARAEAAQERGGSRVEAARGAGGFPVEAAPGPGASGAEAARESDALGRRSSIRAALLLWGGWLLVHYAVFSFSSGTFHPYYTTAMAPAIGALTGIGGVLMWEAYRRSLAWIWVLPVGIALTGGWAFVVLRRTTEFVPWLSWAIAGATVLAVAGLLVAGFGVRRPALAGSARRIGAVALLAGLFAALAGPAAYAVTPLGSGVNGTNPMAGPSTGRGMGVPGGFGGRQMGGAMMPPGGQAGQNGQVGEAGSGQPPGMPGQDGAAQGAMGGNGQETADPGQGGAMGGTGTGIGPGTGGTTGTGTGAAGGMGGMRGGPGGQLSAEMVRYLEKNQGGATWLVAVSSAQGASSAILSTGKPVIAMGGFTGSDPAMTVDKLKEYVSSGKLKYVMVGGGGPGGFDRGSSEVTDWVKANGTLVDASEYGGTTENTTLYKLG